jgi:predicted transcriptional regulator
MSHATLSTSVDERIAARLKIIAKREARSSSGMIANALSLYTLMPKEMRDALHLFAAEDETLLRDVLGEMAVVAVRRKFDFARRKLSESTARAAEVEKAADADLAELAVALTVKP